MNNFVKLRLDLAVVKVEFCIPTLALRRYGLVNDSLFANPS